MGISIEEMKRDEIGEVVGVYNRCLGCKDQSIGEELSKWSDDNTGIFLVAKDGGEIIGIKLAHIEGEVCIGKGLAVEKEYRGMGVGTKLIQEFKERLKEYPNLKQYVFASATNEGIPFHIKMGYVPKVFIQFKEEGIRESISPEGYILEEDIFNNDYDVYQLTFVPKDGELNLNSLKELESLYPDLDISFLFSENFNKIEN